MNELAQQKNHVKEELPEEMISSLVLNGDLRGLNPGQKVAYYRALCQRLGLDPATQPLKLLKLQGREILYCDRSGAQQLNRKHGIGHQIMAREVVNDCYVVTARATAQNGRYEESIGAVPILGLKGEALCNAMMKAETKAKRRSTLDLSGLGMLDESELGEWSAAGQTGTVEELGKVGIETLPKSKVQELREEMKAAEPPKPPRPSEESWKDVICTYGRKDGNIIGKALGHISHFAPVVMDSLYAKFVDPQELKVIQQKDEPMREGLIAWNTWRLEQAEKRKAFEARRQEEVNKSWDEPADAVDEIPMDYPEPEKPF